MLGSNRLLSRAIQGRKFIEHHGWIEFLRRIRIFVLRGVFDRRAGIIQVLTPESVVQPNPGLEIRELRTPDMQLMLRVMYLTGSDIEARFGAGDRCFGVMDDGQIASYMWVKFDVFHLGELYLSFKCKRNQAWFYNAITVKSARGKGYYSALYRHMVNTLKREGISELYACPEDFNVPSLTGMRHAGYTPIVRVEVGKLLWTRRYKMTVFDRKLWEDLRETILNLPRRLNVKVEVASEAESGST